MDNLEQYIKENRESFDNGALPQGSKERFLRKLEQAESIKDKANEAAGKEYVRKGNSNIKYIFTAIASIAAVILIAMFIGGKEEITKQIDIQKPISAEEYISLMNTLDEEIVEMSKNIDKRTAKEVIKASESVKSETIPLEEQLPEELSEQERARILREYYKEKTEGLKRIKTFLAQQTIEEEF